MVTRALDVPVLMLVAKLLEALREIIPPLRELAAPVTVRPRLPVRSCVTVSAPELVVVNPLLPSVKALALDAPRVIVPAVPVAVPASMVTLPELLVVPVALPDWIVVVAELVEAVEVLPEFTLLETRATGTAVSWIRGVISPSQAGAPVPPMFMVSHCCCVQSIPLKAVTLPRFTLKYPFTTLTLLAPVRVSVQRQLASPVHEPWEEPEEELALNSLNSML